MADQELEDAIARLRRVGHFDWILDGPDFVNSQDVAAKLIEMGMRDVTQNKVTGWFRDLDSAWETGRFGLNASRADVIKLLAQRFVKKAVNE